MLLRCLLLEIHDCVIPREVWDVFLAILIFLLLRTVERLGNLLLSHPPFDPILTPSIHSYVSGCWIIDCCAHVFASRTLKILPGRTGTEEPQFLEKHREPGVFSLTPSRFENWAHSKVEKELGNLNFSFLAFLKIHFFFTSQLLLDLC